MVLSKEVKARGKEEEEANSKPDSPLTLPTLCLAEDSPTTNQRSAFDFDLGRPEFIKRSIFVGNKLWAQESHFHLCLVWMDDVFIFDKIKITETMKLITVVLK